MLILRCKKEVDSMKYNYYIKNNVRIELKALKKDNKDELNENINNFYTSETDILV